jgi:hypothetical protein
MKLGILLKALLIAATLFFILVFNISCDGTFYAKGIVYEWINPPAGVMGEVYIEPEKLVNVPESSPVSAQIAFYDRAGAQTLGCSRPSREFRQNQRLTVTSASDGTFDTGAVVSPGKYPMKITINKTGYYPLEKEFAFSVNDGVHFTFTIFLVRKQ